MVLFYCCRKHIVCTRSVWTTCNFNLNASLSGVWQNKHTRRCMNFKHNCTLCTPRHPEPFLAKTKTPAWIPINSHLSFTFKNGNILPSVQYTGKIWELIISPIFKLWIHPFTSPSTPVTDDLRYELTIFVIIIIKNKCVKSIKI